VLCPLPTYTVYVYFTSRNCAITIMIILSLEPSSSEGALAQPNPLRVRDDARPLKQVRSPVVDVCDN